MLERHLLLKVLADLLLAAWVGLRWVLVTADRRARDLHHSSCLRQHLPPSNGYRRFRRDTSVVAGITGQARTAKVHRKRVAKKIAMLEERLDKTSSSAQMDERLAVARLEVKVQMEAQLSEVKKEVQK